MKIEPETTKSTSQQDPNPNQNVKEKSNIQPKNFFINYKDLFLTPESEPIKENKKNKEKEKAKKKLMKKKRMKKKKNMKKRKKKKKNMKKKSMKKKKRKVNLNQHLLIVKMMVWILQLLH